MESLTKTVLYYVDKHDLKNRSRKPRFVHRRIYFFNMMREQGMTLREIGEIFNVHHATIIHGIKRYKELKSFNDKLLELDIACYNGKINYYKKTYDLKKDIMKATTVRDLEIIKSRTENDLYKEFT